MNKLNNTKFYKISENNIDLQDIFEIGLTFDNLNRLKMPRRATKGSAGYDFFSPYDFTLKPGETVKIPTLIRCQIDEGFVLKIYPRSSYGFKYKARLDNTVGIIDQDYFNAKNEGHIWIKITNTGDKVLDIKEGDAFCQGIFVQYFVTCDDDATGERTGGIGSTSEKPIPTKECPTCVDDLYAMDPIEQALMNDESFIEGLCSLWE